MSANDILDVLNIQRDSQPAKKKQKTETPVPRQTGMARELYSLLGPNTPPVNVTASSTAKFNWKQKVSPWTKMEFKPKDELVLHHWVRGSKEILQENEQPYFFKKFNTTVDVPDLVDEETFNKYMEDIREVRKKERERKQLEKQREKEEKEQREKEKREKAEASKKEASKEASTETSKQASKETSQEASKEASKEVKSEQEEASDKKEEKDDKSETPDAAKESEEKSAEPEAEEDKTPEFTYEETKHLFELCKSFELKWYIVYDRYSYPDRTLEDLKEQYYSICQHIYQDDSNANPALIESLGAFSKTKEVERKEYLERLLKRTPAEIAEEESLVIEARRFELAAKKMLIERSNLLTLLDSPQTSQQVQQYQSSQGLANLYNNLMIFDKNHKRRQMQLQNAQDPVPPPIPNAASSSVRRERSFQTHLQQYLASLLKSNSNLKQEPSAIQQLLMKRLSAKEEEAYGLHYHANEKLTPGVQLRSSQRLPGLQQRQSVLKSVNTLLQELDIATAGGTTYKPVMPTRKTMAKYDELLRAVVALLEVKKGGDKLESEITLIRSQRGLQ